MAPRLAYHFAEGHNFARACAYSRMAGDAAYRLFAQAEAIMHYTQALEAAHQSNADAADRIYLYERRGRSLELANRFTEAEQNYNEMAAEGEARNEPALKLAALTASAPLYGTQTPLDNPARAVEVSRQALDLARALNDRVSEAKALSNLSMAEVWTGSDQQQAIAYAEASLAISREMGLQELAAYTLVNIAIGYANLSQIDRALAIVSEARAVWQTLGNRAMEGDSYSMSMWMNAALGRIDQSFQDSEDGIRISQSIGNHWNQVVVNLDLSVLYMERGAI
jgi:tetratricopeptide (TPR) repeat protein